MSRIIDTFEWVEHNELLPEDQHLLECHSSKTLATVTSDARIAWEESLRVAFLAVEHTRIKRTMERIDCVDYSMLQASYVLHNPPNQRAPTLKHRKRWVRATISLSQSWLILSVYWQEQRYFCIIAMAPAIALLIVEKKAPNIRASLLFKVSSLR